MLENPTKTLRVFPAPLAIVILAFSLFSDGQVLHAEGQDGSGAPPPTIFGYNEAPMLAALVAADELPPVEERISDDPLVVEAIEQIGTYGGTLNEATRFVIGGTSIRSAQQSLIKTTVEGSALTSNIVAGWDISNDGQWITLYLRPGMKWSDGSDFTADDFEFWYTYVLLDENITTEIPSRYRSGDEPMQLHVVDPYTVVYEFDRPRFSLPVEWLHYRPFAPKHHMSVYHIEHNPAGALSLAQEAGYDSWHSAFKSLYGYDVNSLLLGPSGTPVVDPFVKIVITDSTALYERNPYYWKVDFAGNQLPYIDAIVVALEVELDNSRSMLLAGTIDTRVLTGGEYRNLLGEFTRARVDLYLWPDESTSTPLAVTLNYTHTETEKREVFLQLDFRRALSLAIDREDMIKQLYPPVNEAYVVGPWTPSVDSHWTGFQPHWWAVDSGYDYDQSRYTKREDVIRTANDLLDGIDLGRRNSDGWRNWRGSTNTLSVVGSYWDPELSSAMELIAEYWKDIGVHLKPELLTYREWAARARINELDATFANTSGGSELRAIARRNADRLMPPWDRRQRSTTSKYMWSDWYASGGTDGDHPPEDIQDLFALSVAYKVESGSPREAAYEDVTARLIDANVHGLYSFGTVKPPPIVIGVSGRLRNFPEHRAVRYGALRYDVDTVYLLPSD